MNHELLSWVGGVIVSSVGILAAHKLPFIPFEIKLSSLKGGRERKMCITKEELQANCEDRQKNLDQKLDLIFSAIEEQRKLITEVRIELGERIARIEGSRNGKL